MTAKPMQTFVGACRALTDRPAAGRILFSGMAPPSREEACLPVINSPAELSDWCVGNPVGAICIGASAPPSDAPVHPALPILFLSALPKDCHGRIALLDPLGCVLFVSPDIGVFNRMRPRLIHPFSDPSDAPLHLPDGKELRVGALMTGDVLGPSAAWRNLLLFPDPAADGEALLYECYRDLAEGALGTAVASVVPYSPAPDDRDAFRNRVRALLRGAVFGRFSVVFRGILTPEDRQDCLDRFRDIVAELEREGREFNGGLSKGLLVDIPLLLRESDWQDFDFLCLDPDRLWDLTTGYSPRTDKEARRAFWHALGDSRAHQSGRPVSVCFNKVPSLSDLSRLCTEWNLTDCFVPPMLLDRTRDRLSQLLGEYQ